MAQLGQGQGYVGILNLAQLAGFGDSYVVDGDQVFVLDQGVPYVYRLAFAPADGLNVVKSVFIPGAWVKQSFSALVGVTQVDWFIDPQNTSGLASDANKGDSAATPLRTGAALFAKTGGYNALWQNGKNYNIYVMSDSLAPDFVMLGGVREPTAGFNVHGSSVAGQAPAANLLFSGTFNAATNAAPATNTHANVTVANGGFDWNTSGPGGTSLISTNALPNKRVRLTSGANSGSVFFAQNRTAAASADVSQLMSQPTLTGLLAVTSGSVVNFVGNETFIVEKLTHIDLFALFLVPMHGTNSCLVESLDFTGARAFSNSRTVWDGCCFGIATLFGEGGFEANFTVLSSQVGGTQAIYGTQMNVYACHVTASLPLSVPVVYNFQFGTLAQGCPLIDGSSTGFGGGIPSFNTANGGGAFASPTSGILCYDANVGSGAAVWGSGHTVVGLAVLPTGRFAYRTVAALTITGGAGEFLLGGATSSRAWDDAGSAFTANITNTWAHLATAIGGGGFGGNAVNNTNGTRISAQ